MVEKRGLAVVGIVLAVSGGLGIWLVNGPLTEVAPASTVEPVVTTTVTSSADPDDPGGGAGSNAGGGGPAKTTTSPRPSKPSLTTTTTTPPVATTKPTLAVPDVTGKEAETAKLELEDLGYKVQMVVTEAGGPRNTVTKTKPPAGTKATLGSTVTVYLTKG
ncbi:PASTA domain-containing protein [Kibdelosporangium aridum]|uniref:PASTA domain-containing protein n=1 Tax=Kibdelosporangium aridum TaxID=2030 RepID=UPI00163C5FB3|nr:PASTA domain-containing protein [Kibdelosporangium aridum]